MPHSIAILCISVVTLTLVRSQGLVGEESCLQIFSVPKKSVVCEPSAEVKASIEAVKASTVKLGEDIGELAGRLDHIDPNVEKQLPEEVQERLAEIEKLKLSHATQVEALRRVEEGLNTSSYRLLNLEASGREELTSMLQQQVRLVQAALEQSNTSLHEQYVTQLTTSTHDLILRLQQLEADLKDQIHDKDGELRTKLDKIRDLSHEEVTELKLQLRSDITSVTEKLDSEMEERLFYFNLSNSHSGALETLRTMLTSIRENQAIAMSDMQNVNKKVSALNTQVAVVEETSTNSMDKATRIEAALAFLEGRMGEVNSGLLQCENQTGDLLEKLAKLKDVVDKREHMLPRTLKIHDCQDVLQFYFPVSGVYQINLNPSTLPYEVFCDLEQTIGWTVIQRRQDGELDFFRGWADYKDGFGSPEKEYWLGLQHIHTMTSQRNYSLRVDLEDWDGKWKYAEYETFKIESEEQYYTLRISGYSGDAGDALSFHNDMPFSTMDKNHDHNDGLCAAMCHGAWWYKDCYHSNLNGRYYEDGNYLTTTGWGDGTVWRSLTQSNYYSLKTVTMKLRQRSSTNTS